MSSLQHQFPTVSLRQLCSLLGVSRSWLYERPHRLLKQQRDVALRDEIEEIVLEYPGYGYRRVTADYSYTTTSLNQRLMYHKP